jgi:hypothetical protein
MRERETERERERDRERQRKTEKEREDEREREREREDETDGEQPNRIAVQTTSQVKRVGDHGDEEELPFQRSTSVLTLTKSPVQIGPIPPSLPAVAWNFQRGREKGTLLLWLWAHWPAD